VACPAGLREALENAVLGTVWMASPLNAALVTAVVTSGAVERVVAAKAKEANARGELAVKKLAPHVLRTRPGAFFSWLSLPPGWTGREMELASRMAGVRVFSAERFAVGGRAAEAAVRLSLTGPETRKELSRGLDLVAEVLARKRPDSSGIL